MKKRKNRLILLLNNELLLFLSISLGIFLFILSFQPFPHDEFDFYYRLLFKVGLGAIVFMFMFLIRSLYPYLLGSVSQSDEEITLSSTMSGFIIWVLSSIAFVLFLKYVGFVNISGYIVFKVVLICFVPPLVLMIFDRLRELRTEKDSLISGNLILQQRVDTYREKDTKSSIDFISGTNGGKLSFILSDILFLKSSDNYVAVYYIDGDRYKQKLVRNTLKNIELQIKPLPNYIRCHRRYIVNTHYIIEQNGNCSNHTLTLEKYPEQIPVSRQYYIKIKDAI